MCAYATSTAKGGTRGPVMPEGDQTHPYVQCFVLAQTATLTVPSRKESQRPHLYRYADDHTRNRTASTISLCAMHFMPSPRHASAYRISCTSRFKSSPVLLIR